jgi:hypothetical protein
VTLFFGITIAGSADPEQVALLPNGEAWMLRVYEKSFIN